jgi:hypothetical protein
MLSSPLTKTLSRREVGDDVSFTTFAPSHEALHSLAGLNDPDLAKQLGTELLENGTDADNKELEENGYAGKPFPFQ